MFSLIGNASLRSRPAGYSTSGVTADPISNTERGRRLQNLMQWLLSELPGVTITGSNETEAAKSAESDLWLQHNLAPSGLPFAEALVPVECKNENTPMSAAEVREFETKIRDSGGRYGLAVARTGLSGSPGKNGHQAITLALSQGISIVVLSGRDLSQMTTTDGLVTLMVERYTELRLRQTYTSL
jgi:hypothetical protein